MLDVKLKRVSNDVFRWKKECVQMTVQTKGSSIKEVALKIGKEGGKEKRCKNDGKGARNKQPSDGEGMR